MNEEPTYLQLTPDFRVFRCDDRNLELEEYREVVSHPNRYIKKETRTNKWVSVGYFSDLPQAINGALKVTENNLTANQRMDLEAVVVELKKISEDLKKAVRESGIKLTDFVKSVDGRGKKSSEVTVAKVKEKNPVTPMQRDNLPKKRGRPKKVNA